MRSVNLSAFDIRANEVKTIDDVVAIMTERGLAEQWVTSDMKTAFLRGARETDVTCVARVLKLGKRTAYGTAECRASNGDLLAHHVLTYALVPSKS